MTYVEVRDEVIDDFSTDEDEQDPLAAESTSRAVGAMTGARPRTGTGQNQAETRKERNRQNAKEKQKSEEFERKCLDWYIRNNGEVLEICRNRKSSIRNQIAENIRIEQRRARRAARHPRPENHPRLRIPALEGDERGSETFYTSETDSDDIIEIKPTVERRK